MPLEKNVRPSSASGRLESNHKTSILAELEGTEQRIKKRPVGWPEKAKDFSAPQHLGVGEDNKDPEWQERQPSNSMNCLIIGKISLDNLQKMKFALEESDASGRGYTDVENFGYILKKCFEVTNMSNEQIHGLFKKIDYSDQGRISWADFSNYLLEQHKAKEETVRRTKKVAFNLPATMSECGHGVPIVNIHSLHNGTVLTVREDGFVCEWSPKLDPQRTKLMFSEGPANRRSKWVTDFTLMSEYKKLMIGTGDGEIQFYELSTLKPYCQISGLETIPLTLDYGYIGSDKCCFLYGDMEGCVTILLLSSADDTLRLWNRLPKDENVPNIAIKNAALSPNVTFVRWKVHHDWVTQVKYLHSFHAVASSSNEESSSLVVGCLLPLTDSAQQLREIREVCYKGKNRKIQLSWTPQVRASGDQTIFSVHKGVKAFDLCQKHCLLVTGGMDRLIRLWNPRFSEKPNGILKGHSAPIFSLCISSEDSRIFSVSTDSTVKVVKVWDFETGRQIFKFNATPDLSTITCMTFDIKGRRLVTGGSNGCLKVWNFNSGQCLKTLKKEGKCQQVCDCIILRVQGNFYVAAVGRDRRIDIYPDVPEDPYHVQRPQPSWKDDLKSGHKEDILCVVQCPPSLLATGSYNGEIIVWNAASGSINCRFVGPLSARDQKTEGLDTSVPSMVFMKKLKLLQHSPTTALLAPGVRGWVNLWDVLSGRKLVSSFKVSKFQQKITKLSMTDEKTLLYAADRIGYIYVYNMESFDPEQRSPRAEHFWRAHTSSITSLEIVTGDQVVLTSSTDHTVRLWSSQGELIGTFGQPEKWNVQLPSSWIHPGVPYEFLIESLSMPHHDILTRKSHLSATISSDVTETDRGELKTL